MPTGYRRNVLDSKQIARAVHYSMCNKELLSKPTVERKGEGLERSFPRGEISRPRPPTCHLFLSVPFCCQFRQFTAHYKDQAP